jgi:hypothetical protein
MHTGRMRNDFLVCCRTEEGMWFLKCATNGVPKVPKDP